MLLEIYDSLQTALLNLSDCVPEKVSIATPFLSHSGLCSLASLCPAAVSSSSRWIICLDPFAIMSGATDPLAVQELLQAGAKVKVFSRLHAKMFLFHGPAPVGIAGSANVTDGGMVRNAEVVIQARDSTLLASLSKLFEQW